MTLEPRDLVAAGLIIGGALLLVVFGWAAVVWLARALVPRRPARDPLRVGALATVATAIPTGGVGTIRVEAGRRSTTPARSFDESSLPGGTEVVVITLEGNVALVARLSDPKL